MPGQKPKYKAFVSREGNDKNFYTEIGAAWAVGQGAISIQLHCLPTDGKLVLFLADKEEKKE
jgi:hypothetical protein